MPRTRLAPQDFPTALHCNRCQYNWLPLTKGNRPALCPNCRSRRWWWPQQMITFLDTLRTERDTKRRAEALRKPA